jgi:hypothetical protein
MSDQSQPPAPPRKAKFIGQWITWWDDDSWEFHSCVRCGEPLTGKRSIKRGYGPGCAAEVTPELVMLRRSTDRAAARETEFRLDRHRTKTGYRRGQRRPTGKKPLTETQADAKKGKRQNSADYSENLQFRLRRQSTLASARTERDVE